MHNFPICRIWHKHLKRYLNDAHISPDGNEILWEFSCFDPHAFIVERCSGVFTSEDYSNIYENDIVEWGEYYPHREFYDRSVVYFERGLFYVELLSGLKVKLSDLSIHGEMVLRVVGNVNENPDMREPLAYEDGKLIKRK